MVKYYLIHYVNSRRDLLTLLLGLPNPPCRRHCGLQRQSAAIMGSGRGKGGEHE